MSEQVEGSKNNKVQRPAGGEPESSGVIKEEGIGNIYEIPQGRDLVKLEITFSKRLGNQS